MAEAKFTVYKISIDKYFYYGRTSNFKRRKKRHLSDLKGQRHDNPKMQKVFNKYKTYKNEIVKDDFLNEEEYYNYEKEVIDKNKENPLCMNLASGGKNAQMLKRILDEEGVFFILSMLEFGNFKHPGGHLSSFFKTSRTTISRVKKGMQYSELFIKYKQKNREERLSIFHSFLIDEEYKEIISRMENGRDMSKTRKLNKEEVFKILALSEFRGYGSKVIFSNYKDKIKSEYSISLILKNQTYKDFSAEYRNLPVEKRKLALA